MWTVQASGTPAQVRASIQKQAAGASDPGARQACGSIALLVGGLKLTECAVEAQGATGGNVHIRLAGRLKDG